METMLLDLIDLSEVTIRNYRDGDQSLLVDVVNQTDQVDQLDQRVTLDDILHEWQDDRFEPQRDGFIAVVGRNGTERAVAAGDAYMPPLEGVAEDIAVFSWHVVRPEWRGSGVGRRIVEACFRRAGEMLGDMDDPRPKLFRVNVNANDDFGKWRLEHLGMQHVRTFYRMEYAPLDGALASPQAPAGVSIVPWAPEHDRATLDAFNESFRDHWGFRDIAEEMWHHWFHSPKSRPDLWRLALDDRTGEVAGFCIVTIDPDRNAALGRREGWVRDLGVRRPWRKRGLGTALLLAGMATLREAGMTSARLGVDSDSLTNATRLYERVGYRVVQEWLLYQKPIG